jgi:hypothetical protein
MIIAMQTAIASPVSQTTGSPRAESGVEREWGRAARVRGGLAALVGKGTGMVVADSCMILALDALPRP